jgi:hypothetical protein
VDHKTLAAAQENDTELRDFINSNTYALQLKKIRFADYDVEIYCAVSSDTVRITVYVEILAAQRI